MTGDSGRDRRMVRVLSTVGVVIVGVVVSLPWLADAFRDEPEPEVVAVPSPSPDPDPTQAPTPTPSPQPVAAPTATEGPTPTPLPTPTPTPFEGLVDPTSVGQPWGEEVRGLLTFRGNPTRTYYGEGPVPRNPRVVWSYPGQSMCGNTQLGGEIEVGETKAGGARFTIRAPLFEASAAAE